MGGLFSKPKAVKTPPVSAEEPPPAIEEIGVEEAERRRIRRRRGRRETFLTGALMPGLEGEGKKRVLG